MRAADHLVDMGPGAGEHGGGVVAQGPPAVIAADPASLTGAVPVGQAPHRGARPAPPAACSGSRVRGARQHNLKHIDVDLPAGRLHGASPASRARASRRSSTRSSTRARRRALMRGSGRAPGRTAASTGSSSSTRSSTSTSRRSAARRAPTRRPTPACSTTSASSSPRRPRRKVRGYKPGRFSFNVKGGRCEACKGDGLIKIEMHFLPDVYVPCEVCKGQRYNRDTLEVHYKGKNIAEVLDMSVDEALHVLRQRAAHRAPAARRWTTSASATSSWASRRPRSRAARRSASSSPRELAQGRHRPHPLHPRRAHDRACTSPTSRSCSTCCSAWSTRATRWS